jgi:hypothetical protein
MMAVQMLAQMFARFIGAYLRIATDGSAGRVIVRKVVKIFHARKTHQRKKKQIFHTAAGCNR